MDSFGYKFSRESKADLFQFLSLANKMKTENAYCDMEEYERLKNFFPLDWDMQAVDSYVPNSSVDKCLSDEELDDKNNSTITKNSQILHRIKEVPSQQNATTDDIVYSIKENLVTKQTLPNCVLLKLNQASRGFLEKVFQALVDELNMEEVLNLWVSLLDFAGLDGDVVQACLKFLFLSKAKSEYCEETQNIFSRLVEKYYPILKKELASEIHGSKAEDPGKTRILLQYISHLSNTFKTDLFREFIFNCEKLHPNYIPVIETLLTSHTEYDLLNKLIEVMSNAATEYATDKSYGKLLFNVVRLLDKDVVRLEQPLKHISGTHRSIWKRKVDKIVINMFDESLTQSFR